MSSEAIVNRRFVPEDVERATRNAIERIPGVRGTTVLRGRTMYVQTVPTVNLSIDLTTATLYRLSVLPSDLEAVADTIEAIETILDGARASGLRVSITPDEAIAAIRTVKNYRNDRAARLLAAGIRDVPNVYALNRWTPDGIDGPDRLYIGVRSVDPARGPFALHPYVNLVTGVFYRGSGERWRLDALGSTLDVLAALVAEVIAAEAR